jgi:acetylornithine/N-succinyldiaminopimelate aminotransferase
MIEEMAGTVRSAGQKLEGIRPPAKEHAESYKKMLGDVAQYRGRPLFYNYIGSGLGNGPYVELEDGSVKLDLINGIGVHILGHSHPAVVRGALKGAAADIVMQGNLQPNREYLEMEAKLSDLASRRSPLTHVWFATCGTIANENALKMCRQKRNGAPLVVAFSNAFAGRSTMMSELTDNPAYKVGQPRYNEILRLPFINHKADAKSKEGALNVLKEYVAKHENNIGCFTFEPMQGEGGYRYPSRDFLVPLLEFCKEHGIPVWADEVQTFCRTGNFFAFETFDIGKYIDVCTIAKTAQAGATLFTPEMKPDAGLLGGTFSGSSAALSAGLAGLNELDNGSYMGAEGKISKISKAFIAMLRDLEHGSCKGMIDDADGLGLMVAFTPFDGSKEKQLAVAKKFFENGLMAFGCGHDPYRIRFLIPAVLEEKHIQVARSVIEKSLQELA